MVDRIFNARVTGQIGSASPASLVQSGALRAAVMSAVVAVALASGQAVLAQAKPTAGQVEAARGVGFVQTPGAAPRALGQGALVAEGDTLTTGKDSFAILKLTDGTRMTVRPNTELVMNTYRYEPAAQTGSMVFGLLRGGLRTLTGLIAKSSPDAAKIRTATATIGIRGTEFVMSCLGECAGEAPSAAAPGTGCEVFTVESEVILTPTAPSCTSKDLSIVAGSGIRLAANCTPEVFNTLPPGAVPAIDIPIDMDRLFGLQTPQESETGLFLFVRDGHIEIDSGGTLLHLGRGETGQLELGGTSLRPAFIPRFIEFDVIPLATGTGSVMDLVRGVGVSAASVCKK
jgi:hypothetical protein